MGKRGPKPASTKELTLRGSWRARARAKQERGTASSRPTISEQLIQALEWSELSMSTVGNRTMIPAATLRRFVRGEGELKTDQLDCLAGYLGLTLAWLRDLDDRPVDRDRRKAGGEPETTDSPIDVIGARQRL